MTTTDPDFAEVPINDWLTGSRVVTYKNALAMVATSEMSVKDAQSLIGLLNKYDVRPYDIAEVQTLRKKLAGRDIDIELLRAELVDRRAHCTDLLESNNRYLQRARDAEALVKVLQARLAAQAPASTEAA